MSRLHPNEMPSMEILEAAGKVADWFADRNITEWKLDGIERRLDWISVKARLPKTNLPVLVHGQWHNDAPLYAICAIHDGRWHSLVGGGSLWGTVTHWMPLPEAPK